jgi:hypothetical protein
LVSALTKTYYNHCGGVLDQLLLLRPRQLYELVEGGTFFEMVDVDVHAGVAQIRREHHSKYAILQLPLSAHLSLQPILNVVVTGTRSEAVPPLGYRNDRFAVSV